MSVNLNLLRQIGNGDIRFIAKTKDAEDLLLHNPPLIEINTSESNPENRMEVGVRLTAEGIALISLGYYNINPNLNQTNSSKGESKNMSNYEILDGVELPTVKRGGRGGGAPTKYPFDSMEVGKSFFVPATSTYDPVKKMTSVVSAAMHRFSEKTGEIKTVERSKRGAKNKLILDEGGHKIMETKQVEVVRFTRKFVIRAAKAGVKYGNFVAPSDGALIARTQ